MVALDRYEMEETPEFCRERSEHIPDSEELGFPMARSWMSWPVGANGIEEKHMNTYDLGHANSYAIGHRSCSIRWAQQSDNGNQQK